MDYFKSQLDRIQQQLGGLSASQKMLTASLVAIMIMTLVWWGRYAGEAEMTPVLDTALSSNDAGNIERTLRGANIPVKISGDRVLVPTDRRDEAIAMLSIADALPTESADAFDDLAKKMNPFMSNAQTDVVMKAGKEKLLASVIRKFPGVQEAKVVITPGSGRKFGPGVEATGIANIFMRSGRALDSKSVQGAALLIARSESGLKPSNVSVLVDGRPQRVRSNDDGSFDGGTTAYTEDLQIAKRTFEDSITSSLSYIQSVIVRCAVTIDTANKQTQSREYDKDNVISTPRETETKTVETVAPSGPRANEAGVIANIGQADTSSASAGGATSSETTERITNDNRVGEKVQTIAEGPGKVTLDSVAVQIGRSHIVNQLKRGDPSAKEPDEPAIAALSTEVMETVKRNVMFANHLTEDKVDVSFFYDAPPMLAAAITESPLSDGVTSKLTGHVKEIAIGALAVVSLFMLMMMVKKGAVAPLVVPNSLPMTPQTLESMSELAGVVRDGDPMLDGLELDDDAVKAQQMLAQVQTMVKENPDGAANLVKRWLNRN